MSEIETRPLESDQSPSEPLHNERKAGWFKISAIAAASALAGGLAAAWYYRKTLHTLRHADADAQNPDFGISETTTEDGV